MAGSKVLRYFTPKLNDLMVKLKSCICYIKSFHLDNSCILVLSKSDSKCRFEAQSKNITKIWYMINDINHTHVMSTGYLLIKKPRDTIAQKT